VILVLDQGLPRSTTQFLRNSGIEAYHTGDIGLAEASDGSILDHARLHGRVVVTLDADFHALLARSGSARPSVIRIRIEGLKGRELAQLLLIVLDRCGDDLESGAMVTVTPSGIRERRLPLVRL